MSESESPSGVVISRRTLLRAASILAVASPAAAQLAPESAAGAASNPSASTPTPPPAVPTPPPSGAPQLFWTTEISTGKVMGLANGPVKQFKGIPYGASTGGANRYMPPQKPAPWTGVRECFSHGPISPQIVSSETEYGRLIQWDQHVGGMGEDCLTVNVWTPSVDRAAKKAVMVCFHGGGYSSGSGNAPGFDGAMMARAFDVVVVTVNHRLNVFGYVNLVDAGAPSEFQYAGVCGIMDLTAALGWVRTNIEAFGGDPGRVMIFGQSGGGAKTSVMLGNPAARGLFHRAGVQSGSTLRIGTRDGAAASAAALLRALGIDKSNAAAIQKKPWQEILQAMSTIAAQGISGFAFSPVLDGTYLPHHPFDPGAPLESAEVPVIISTTLHDSALSLTNFDLDDAGLRAIVARTYGDKADAIIAAQKAARPKDSNYLIQAAIATDASRGRGAYVQADRKVALGKAPTYVYQWDWASNMADGKFGAIHGLDVSATLNNARDVTMSGGSKAGQRMAYKISSAWAAFAKTGDPNNNEIPVWPAFDAQKRAVMVWDDDIRVVNDYRGDLIRMLVPTS